jgi:P-type Ca2+ transporter type 2C
MPDCQSEPPGVPMSVTAPDSPTGLTAAEARERLVREGANELPVETRRPIWRVAAGVMREPMFALLIAAAVVYGVVGDLAEAVLLLVFATISVTIAVVQQGRSERALDALRDLASPRALVVRDGQRARIPGAEVVRGDLVVVAEGDRVVADGVLVAGAHFEVDESLLTGEALAVRKSASSSEPAEQRLFGGTLITRGSGLMLVTATGPRSAIGGIGRSLATVERAQPRLERETRRLVIGFGIAAASFSILATALHAWLRDSWLEALLGGIALGMALLPEEFPLVLTVFMVMGAWRLSRSRVLTRRAAAIEALGAATVLCTDKTGTLTRNLMSVAHLQAGAQSWAAAQPATNVASSAALAELLATAVLASDDQRVDPMERALLDLEQRAGGSGRNGTSLRDYPLRPELLAVTRVWDRGDPQLFAATKGAPEAIARLCALPPEDFARELARVESLASRGVRVLAVARASIARGALPSSVLGMPFQFLGFVGFTDPLRESVPGAVRECRSAGVRVVMITGDHPATARAIAEQAGIEQGVVLTGADLAALDDAALAREVRRVSVFARIAPEQKLRIVESFRANGEVVAMTGDGVNDAPALKSAHIGIAMGGRGTDVAREAASMVLLDDDFGSIVRAIRLGRRIYDNLRKAMGYILAIHVPIAGLALLPIVLGWPLILTPMLIALLELIIDPACSVVLEAEGEEQDVMRRPPRAADRALLAGDLIAWSVFQGGCALAAVAAVLLVGVRSELAEPSLRSATFLALVGANIALIFVNRTFGSTLRETFCRPNRVLWWGLGITALVLGIILAIAPLRAFFGLGLLALNGWLPILGVVVVLLVALELAKAAWRRRLQS